MPIIIETTHEFDARHSAHGPKLGDTETHRELFSDGAVRTRSGEQLEPPTEPGELLLAKRGYVALKLRLEEERWRAFKSDCEQLLANKSKYANPLPGPPSDAKELLEAGAKCIVKLREELAGFDREISNLPNERARRAFLEQKRADQQAVRGQLNDIIGVHI